MIAAVEKLVGYVTGNNYKVRLYDELKPHELTYFCSSLKGLDLEHQFFEIHPDNERQFSVWEVLDNGISRNNLGELIFDENKRKHITVGKSDSNFNGYLDLLKKVAQEDQNDSK